MNNDAHVWLFEKCYGPMDPSTFTNINATQKKVSTNAEFRSSLMDFVKIQLMNIRYGRSSYLYYHPLLEESNN